MERNREAVLSAASRVFVARGYAGATLEAIADEAGFSRGVVYSQFGSKADMFFALLERRITERAAQNERIAKEFAGADGLRQLMRAAQQDAAAEPGWAHLLVEFRALAMRDADLNKRYGQSHARTIDGISSALERLYEPAGLQPTVPVRSIAEFFQAGAAGVALERAANPDALPEQDIAKLTYWSPGINRGQRRRAATMTVATWHSFRDDVVDALNAGMLEQFGRRTWNAQRIHQTQRLGLQTLLSYAIEHSPFHRSRLAGTDLTDLDPTDLSRLPVMTKAEMMEALDEVFTDRRLRRLDIDSAVAATGDQPIPILSDFVALATGGCSGRRGVFVYDRAGITSFMSAVARPPVESDPSPAAEPPRIAMVTAPSAVHATGLAIAMTAGGKAPAHADPIPATLPIEEIVDRLNRLQPDQLSGYATMLVRLATEAGAGRLRISPTQVMSTSETLLPEMRSAVREAFGVAVFDSFGSTEGLFGKTGPDDDVFTFNTDMCIVELVDADNRPVPPGVPSAKVLVTNLYNFVQPLIRYELTDAFVRQPGCRRARPSAGPRARAP